MLNFLYFVIGFLVLSLGLFLYMFSAGSLSIFVGQIEVIFGLLLKGLLVTLLSR